MLSVDNRAGSAQMAPILQKLGLEVELTQMAFGDVAFLGMAHGGDPVSIGIEMKSVDDCLACVTSGRYAGHQLPGLIASYDHIWLLIQGEWRMGRNGELLQHREGRGGGQYWAEAGGGLRRWMWRDFEGWINSVSILGGTRVHRVATWQEGAEWIKCLYNWFQRTEHKSTQVMYGTKELFADQALLIKPTLARRVAAQLPGIGEKRSAEVARQFHTLAAMVDASPKDWLRVEGIGKGIATKVYQAIHQNGTGK
jgi:ERCC4-type nuclease